jgi:hypothetical protein
MALASLSKRLPSHQTSLLGRSASLGIRSRVCPAADISSARPLPDAVASAVWTGHCQVTRSRSARGFSPLRRFTPRRGLGFVAPQSRPGFTAFRRALPTSSRPKPTVDGDDSPLPAMRFTPFEEFLSSVAVLRHRSRCPHAVRFAYPPLEHRSTPTTGDTCRQAVHRRRTVLRTEVPSATR